ncbi:uncharacterized protein LOC102707074 [Oryza brachyantha]|uniref:uncharacterized protein LOC102707074 n=1 Tax=Oryza brachyantha TaxID=4533 RepID=UPI001ADC5989|nr:uncharacterized protein LOC102707074 [Oryza brachyantha]
MSSAGGTASTTSTYAESVASCPAPTHLMSRAPPPPPPPAHAAVRRQLDFAGGGELDDDEDDDFLFRAAEETERRHFEAKRRAPAPPPPEAPAFLERQCICGRGACIVEERESRRWVYVCPSTPKCRYSVWCEEADLCPNPQPAFISLPKPYPRVFNSPCSPGVFNSRSNQLAGATTPTPSNHHIFNRSCSPGVFKSPSNHLAGATTPTPSNPQDFNGPRNPHVFNYPRNSRVSNSPSNHQAGATPPVNARSINKPTCYCGAGKCIKTSIKGQKYYVCCIKKGHGACSYCVLVDGFVEESPQTRNDNQVDDNHGRHSPVKVEGNNENGPTNPDQHEYDEWPFDIINNDVVCNGFMVTTEPTLRDGIVAGKSSSTRHEPNATVEVKTPTESPMPPSHGSGCCFRCGEDGHWSPNCPKPASSPLNSPCFHCGKLGHWRSNCPALHDTRGY